MILSYENLKRKVVKVEVIKDLILGNIMDYGGNEAEIYEKLKQHLNEENDVVVKKGSKVKLCQMYNFGFEIELSEGLKLDVYFDDEDELNDYLQFIEVEGRNNYFVQP